MPESSLPRASFPGGRRFAFTVFDDTDHATVDNVAPVYRLLRECGLRTTKSVWVYPSRDSYTGGSLADPLYREFILDLQRDGFEIASHGVGSGAFTSDEIRAGYEEFRRIVGSYPRSHANHASNPDSLYWGAQRFVGPVAAAYAALAFFRGDCFSGEDPMSPHYWGDWAREHLTYVRDLTFGDINTLRSDPKMPWRVRERDRGSNYWFSSSDGHRLTEFTALLAKDNVDRLVADGGVCIVYTHFASGFVDSRGRVERVFEERLRYLAAQDGWFVPVSPLLDHLRTAKSCDAYVTAAYRTRLSFRWARDRLWKRIRFGS